MIEHTAIIIKDKTNMGIGAMVGWYGWHGWGASTQWGEPHDSIKARQDKKG